MDLTTITQQLKEHLDRLKAVYDKNDPPESNNDKDFFSYVKEKTTPIYELLAVWEEEALKIVKEEKINVHPHQITSTRENMELVLMHSYYIDVRRKRYMELNRSIHYIFDQLLREIS
ncbi:DUF1798 family protein [Ornithinibacillus sp. L9]|uniref:DUF1798 family protein n=1 Tax=Ornithinibacillus caprae TaxID=2678566 RepID=A0A6N8FDN7_9BACI|nr:DUF1798 family protein [Ornithinibacillus caprae]MUK87301.1 DUF1798 family protein [Ornithinibacillus caprae]